MTNLENNSVDINFNTDFIRLDLKSVFSCERFFYVTTVKSLVSVCEPRLRKTYEKYEGIQKLH